MTAFWKSLLPLALGASLCGLGIVLGRAVAAEEKPLADGIYLYGQSAQPNQIGQDYFVFELHRGEANGAFYQPQSSFDCFYGILDGEQLHLTVVGSYDQTPSPYSVQLPNYYPIAQVGSNDRRILNICKANHREKTATKNRRSPPFQLSRSTEI